MQAQDIFARLDKNFAGAVGDWKAEAAGATSAIDPYCVVKAERLREVATFLRDEPDLAFDFLQCITGVDYPKESRLTVVYHLFSYRHRHYFIFKVHLDRADPVLDSLADLWKAANWQERECYDLLGVHFDGHPDLRRVLMPDDWVGYPLRKDYAEGAEYHGIPTTRPNPLELLKIQPAKPAAPAAKPAAPPQAAPAPKPAAPAAPAAPKPAAPSPAVPPAPSAPPAPQAPQAPPTPPAPQAPPAGGGGA